jgi:hypothetical protein
VPRFSGPRPWVNHTAYRADLTYRVISTEQGKPVWLPARGRYIARWTDGHAGNGNGRKRRLPCNRADRGCVASWDNITSLETELTSRWCLNSRPLEEPMKEAKQMTTGQPVGAASHMADGFSSGVRIGSKSLSSRSGFFWIRLRPRFSGGRF